MYLFFDTETSDKPRNWKAPASEVDNWPRLVQLGWVCCNRAGRVTAQGEYLIKPEGFTIAKGATAVHGITTSRARKEGVKLRPVLEEFAGLIKTAKVLASHNLVFDQNVMTAEFLRAEMAIAISRKTCHCTMRESTNYCRLPGPYGYKWPKLSELHQVLFGEPLAENHSALADAETCMKCFFRLKKLGIIG